MLRNVENMVRDSMVAIMMPWFDLPTRKLFCFKTRETVSLKVEELLRDVKLNEIDLKLKISCECVSLNIEELLRDVKLNENDLNLMRLSL
jgi:hypothetical protein